MNSKNQPWFLGTLFKESRIGFAVVVLFFGGWLVAMGKKMDMTLFPRNDMFSGPSLNADTLKEVYVYLNGQPLEYASLPYWEKDRLQTSAASYVRYLDHNRMTRTECWLRDRAFNVGYPHLLKRLTARSSVTDEAWLTGYTQSMGMTLQSGDILHLCQLRFTVRKGIALIHQTDTITTFICP